LGIVNADEDSDDDDSTSIKRTARREGDGGTMMLKLKGARSPAFSFLSTRSVR
jgi:hypothetical protein